MYALKPLEHSQAYDSIESGLKQLTIALFQAYMATPAQDINIYGTPFLGSRALILKSLVADNIGNFEAENVPKDVLRYLLMARRYRNGKRGLHLLDTYLRALWQADYQAYQLYFRKDGVYPQDASLFSPTEVAEIGGNPNAYVRTGRVRIELNPAGDTDIPSDVANSLDDTLPARLFVHDIVVKREMGNDIMFASVADFASLTSEVIEKVLLDTENE